MVKLLLKLGADPNTYGITGGQRRTPLTRAMFNGHVEVMELLLAAGAYPRPANFNACVTPTKAQQELLDTWAPDRTAQVQLDREAWLVGDLQRLSDGWDPIHRRARMLDRLRARWLDLAAAGAGEDLQASLAAFAKDEVAAGRTKPGLTAQTATDSLGRNLLVTAAWKGNISVVRMLCGHWKKLMRATAGMTSQVMVSTFKVELNHRFGPWCGAEGWTALSVAGHMGHVEVVRVLQQYGASTAGNSLHGDALGIAKTITNALGLNKGGQGCLRALEGGTNPYLATVSARSALTGGCTTPDRLLGVVAKNKTAIPSVASMYAMQFTKAEDSLFYRLKHNSTYTSAAVQATGSR